MLVLGIDEAGRGAVIGPLVLAGVLIEAPDAAAANSQLRALGVADSKRLTREARAALAPKIRELVAGIEVLAIEPAQLERNLTQIELEAAARLIAALRPHLVYLDVPAPPRGVAGYLARLRSQLFQLAGNMSLRHCRIIGENRADARYPIVSAASIIAKVERDRAILELHEEYGDFGWGYPGEPKTRRFLREWQERHGSFPGCVRTRWRTVRAIE